MVRRARERPANAVFVLATLVPAPVRRAVSRPLAPLAAALARRPGTHDLVPQLAFIARWAGGDAEAAARLAAELGRSAHATTRARRELAELSLRCHLRPVARAILDASDDADPRAELMRARIDLAEGRYGPGLEHARAAAAGGLASGTTVGRELSARLAILSAGWQPELGDEARRTLERARGSAVHGRILHVLFASLPHRQSGYTVRSHWVAKAQRDAGLDPRLATRAGFPRNAGVAGARREETFDGIPYYRLAPDFRARGLRDTVVAESARAAAPLVERLRPAALHAASDHVQAQIALAVGRAIGVPVVYEVRGFWEETWASHPWHDQDEALTADHYLMTRATETRCMLASDAVVTLSETMRGQIVERGCLPENVVVIPNAVDVDWFRPIPRSDDLASSLGIEPGDEVLGYLSTFNRYEGIQYLLDAAATLREKGRRVRVLLVGEGDDGESIAATAHRLGLDDGTLIMPGRVAHDDVLRYYSLIDVFVVPRTAARVSQLVTPLKPYEAMAMELPVVVSDLPALREIVSPGETGLTFRAEDAADLAEVLTGLLDDRELRSRLGRQAREWILANRTWTENGRLYRRLYERLGAA